MPFGHLRNWSVPPGRSCWFSRVRTRRRPGWRGL